MKFGVRPEHTQDIGHILLVSRGASGITNTWGIYESDKAISDLHPVHSGLLGRRSTGRAVMFVDAGFLSNCIGVVEANLDFDVFKIPLVIHIVRAESKWYDPAELVG